MPRKIFYLLNWMVKLEQSVVGLVFIDLTTVSKSPMTLTLMSVVLIVDSKSFVRGKYRAFKLFGGL